MVSTRDSVFWSTESAQSRRFLSCSLRRLPIELSSQKTRRPPTHWSCLGCCGQILELAKHCQSSPQSWCPISPRRRRPMPHELIAGLEAGALVLLALLLVPKRRGDHLRSRLWDLGSGRRRWLFEPPPSQSANRARNIAAYAADALDLGIPLYVAGRLAGQRS